MAITGIIISCLAVLFSLFTFFFYDKKIKKLDELIKKYQLKQFEKEEIEKKKAHVNASIVVVTQGKKTLHIHNIGMNDAKNIRLDLLSDNEGVFLLDNIFPYEKLGPQEDIYVHMLLSEGCSDVIKIKIKWDDEFQENNEKIQVLQLC